MVQERERRLLLEHIIKKNEIGSHWCNNDLRILLEND
jgi:hypothetical protein